MLKSRPNRLGFAILLVFCCDRGQFPRAESEIDRNRRPGIKITCRGPLSPWFFPVSMHDVFARSRISRMPPQASPQLSQLYHREGFPPAAGGRTLGPVPPKLSAKTDDPRRTQTRCGLSAASLPSITVPVARQRHSARMHGLILSRVVRQDQLRRIFEDPSSRLDKSTGSPIPTSFGFT